MDAKFDAVEVGFDKLPSADQLAQGRANHALDTGAANAYVVALSKAPSAYTAGLQVRFLAANANTGASTLNVNGLGVKNLRRQDGTALRAGDILVGMPVSATYDGTRFLLDTSTAAMVANAEAAQAAASASQAAAANSATNAAASATAALASQNAAATSATNAAASEVAADASETSAAASQVAATASQAAAATSASAASTSATNAADSASSAATSATSASGSATAASGSANSAAGSAAAALTRANNAAASEANATASEVAAALSESNSAASEAAAAASETAAGISETNAAGSATAAAGSETSAAGSASSAATSAANAAISETNAAVSAGNAATSESNAAASEAAAAASYDSFDDRYLGPKASDPATDNDGDPLLTGALYFNTAASEMRIWSGSSWTAAYLPVSGYAPISRAIPGGGAVGQALVKNSASDYDVIWGTIDLSTKADLVHGHAISDVTGLQAALDGKSDAGHGHDYLPLAGGVLTGMIATRTNNAAFASANDSTFSVRGDVSNAALMTFHRAGAYAVNFGLDTDNKLKVGGWSMGSVYEVYHEGRKPTYDELGVDKTTYYYNPASFSPTRQGNLTVIQNWSLSGAAYTLNDASWQVGDIVTISTVRGYMTYANATRIYLPNGSYDTSVYLAQPGRITLAKYTGTASYWMVLP
ncbi:MAG: hypothetical protein V2I24_14480 [Halieaceae bacterium]|nr:hypothetical protein [Halieaceae bacterium]